MCCTYFGQVRLNKCGQLSKPNVIVMYINLRSAGNINAYPPRGDIPADTLASRLEYSEDDYADRRVALFHALFDTLRYTLTAISAKRDTRAQTIESWSKRMCRIGLSHRRLFLTYLRANYNTVGLPLAESPVQYLTAHLLDSL